MRRSGIPPLCRSIRSARINSCLNCFTARRSRSRTWRCNCWRGSWDHVLAKRNQKTTIVVATSGDTGGAAVDAFKGLNNVDLIVLFPHGRISDVQRLMMTTSGAGNVHALAVEGHFDDCQNIVKGLFNNHKFRDEVSLSGVNSINWARIVAQVVYYFTSAVALGSPAREVDFTVPTGNFGDIFAATSQNAWPSRAAPARRL